MSTLTSQQLIEQLDRKSSRQYKNMAIPPVMA